MYFTDVRIGQVLNVYWEKTTETILHKSVSQAVDELMQGVRLVDYTTTESLLTSSLIQSSKSAYILLYTCISIILVQIVV